MFPRAETSLVERNPARTPPDFAAMHEQLRQHRHLTLQLLWEEYRCSLMRRSASASCASFLDAKPLSKTCLRSWRVEPGASKT